MERYERQIGVGGLILTDYEKQLVNEVLDSGRLTYGPMTKRFEAEFAAAHGCAHGLFMNSGTSALHLGLQAMKTRFGWQDGDEVIVPAVTFVATANIVLHNNMTPVFVDVEPDTFNLDPRLVEEKITPRTRAIIPVHLLGLPATMGPLLEIAKRHGLRVMEDSCEAMYAHYNGQPVGSMGDIGTFSTYLAHILVTGVGGLATTNDPLLAGDLRSLMNHGRDTDDLGARRFTFLRQGHSARATEMEAALGIGQMARADEIIGRRRALAARLTERLARFSDRLQVPSCPADRTHSYMFYGVVARDGGKAKLVEFLERRNIETRDLLPLVNQPVYTRLYGEHLEDRFPVAKHLNHSGFYVGCHPYLTDDEVDFIGDSFESYFKG